MTPLSFNLELLDKNGVIVNKVTFYDEKAKFYLVYSDLKENGYLNSMKLTRVYGDFTIRPKTVAIVKVS